MLIMPLSTHMFLNNPLLAENLESHQTSPNLEGKGEG